MGNHEADMWRSRHQTQQALNERLLVTIEKLKDQLSTATAPSPSALITSVEAFSEKMFLALQTAGPRPGKVEDAERNGWTDDTPDELYELLQRYRLRLATAMENRAEYPDQHAVAMKECINVANAAMMVRETLELVG
jgi:hypothetical protein